MSAYWDRQADHYDRVTHFLNSQFSEMAEAIGRDLPPGSEVLELGAGTGLVTRTASPSARRYVATDQSAGMLSVLSSRTLGVETQTADATALPFGDESFDAVVAANLLHLLPRPELALTEANRVLRPDGRLLVPTFSHGRTTSSMAVSWLLTTAGFPLQHRFRGDDLSDLVRNRGFQITETRWFPGLLPICYLAAVRR